MEVSSFVVRGSVILLLLNSSLALNFNSLLLYSIFLVGCFFFFVRVANNAVVYMHGFKRVEV